MRDFMRDRLTYTPKGVCMHSEASPTSKSTSRHFRTAHLRPGRSRKIAFPAHRRRQPPGPAWPGEPLELESLSIPSGLKRPGVASTRRSSQQLTTRADCVAVVISGALVVLRMFWPAQGPPKPFQRPPTGPGHSCRVWERSGHVPRAQQAVTTRQTLVRTGL